MVDRGLGGVEVLGALVGLGEPPGPKAYGGPRHVPYGPDEAVTEAVVDAGAAGPGAQPGLHQLVLGVAGVAQAAGQVVPARGGVADGEVGGGEAVEAAPGQEVAGRLGLGGGQLLGEEGLGQPVGVQEALAGARLHAPAHSPALLVAQLDAGPPRQVLHRLGKGQVVDLLHEGDDVPALPAPEAVEQAQLGAHVEGGGALVVEGAQSLETAHAGGLEGDVLPGDVLDAGALTHRLNVLALDQSRHGPILGRAPRGGRCGTAAPRPGRTARRSASHEGQEGHLDGGEHAAQAGVPAAGRGVGQ